MSPFTLLLSSCNFHSRPSILLTHRGSRVSQLMLVLYLCNLSYWPDASSYCSYVILSCVSSSHERLSLATRPTFDIVPRDSFLWNYINNYSSLSSDSSSRFSFLINSVLTSFEFFTPTSQLYHDSASSSLNDQQEKILKGTETKKFNYSFSGATQCSSCDVSWRSVTRLRAWKFQNVAVRHACFVERSLTCSSDVRSA